MTAPAPSWATVPVYGTYKNPLTGVPLTGSVRFTIGVRINDNTDDIIFPAGSSVTLQLVNGVLTTAMPAMDDPDIAPAGTGILVEELLTGGEKYYIVPTLAMLPGGLDLRTVVTGSGTTTPDPAALRSVAGGLAGLDSAGDVINAAGVKVLPGGGGGGTLTAGSVLDVHVANNAAIKADKLADGVTRVVMTAAERTRLANYDANLGMIAVDSFSGTDVAKFQAAYAICSTDTYPRSMWFSNRLWDLRALPVQNYYSGLRIMGPGGGMGREFRETSAILVNPSGWFGGSLAGAPRDIEIRGISVQSTGWVFAPFATDNSAGNLADFRIIDCGFQVAQVMAGTYKRLNLSMTYTNGLTGTGYTLGGSDSDLWVDGDNYCSGTLPAGSPFISLGMSQTQVGAMYVTPQGGYALEITYSAGGLTIDGFKSDCWGRSGAQATQQAGIKIKAGSNIELRSPWIFNSNAAAFNDANHIVVTGGSGLIISKPKFNTTYDGWTAVRTTGPALSTTVPIVVEMPRYQGTGAVKQMKGVGLITLVNDVNGTTIV